MRESSHLVLASLKTSMDAATHDAAADRPASSSKHPRAPRNRTPAPSQPPQSMGMSPTSRYNHNLKVLRRRDPSIISIFDQFSHVCVYHHNGMKWEKQGFEGSMFLYERYVSDHNSLKVSVLISSKRVLPPLWLLYPQPYGHGRLYTSSVS